MASKKNQAMTIAQYNEIRRGYAEAQGFDPDNLTEEQDQEVSNLMEKDSIFQPKQSLALPGAINGNNPTSGNLAPTEAAKPAAQTDAPIAAGYDVSAADRDSDIERLYSHLAREGDRAGAFGSQIFRATYSRALNSGITDMVAEGLKSSSARDGGVEGFLQRKGY